MADGGLTLAAQTIRLVDWVGVVTIDLAYDDVSGVCASLAYAVAAGVTAAHFAFARQPSGTPIDRRFVGGATGTVSLPQQTNQRLLFSTATGTVSSRRNSNFGYVVDYEP